LKPTTHPTRAPHTAPLLHMYTEDRLEYYYVKIRCIANTGTANINRSTRSRLEIIVYIMKRV
jgi:hypothetical protein